MNVTNSFNGEPYTNKDDSERFIERFILDVGHRTTSTVSDILRQTGEIDLNETVSDGNILVSEMISSLSDFILTNEHPKNIQRNI